MPFDPNPAEEIQVVPLSRLSPDGAWQTELAHDRSEHLLIWVTRGQGRFLMDGAQRGFGTHSALFFPARALLSVEFGRQCLGQALRVPVSSPVAMPDRPMHLKITDTREQARLNTLLESMVAEQSGHPALWRRALQSYSELISIQLRRLPPSGPLPPSRPSAARRLSQAYCQRVADFYDARASMADHAAALSVTPTHLTRVCKAETGKTAAALLMERQLHAARILLISSDITMRDIADRLGFGSAAYFTRFITQHTGQTPSTLRKAARKRI
ncbi:Arabinose operon regulatory protein [Phaeobacter sp. CECT 5382]|uniref:helix-turn-helix transcriptional regulator n=1 Tax=Rhodobacterales TaxID=204455 RepID=UPI0006D951B5|nr:helix-turn-helix transcriptional regulator [Phaeobacter sp. CECT 5382]CUH88460.1 Arabinose operon regulatory protein [Phaeobacter sp. CECT 5382]